MLFFTEYWDVRFSSDRKLGKCFLHRHVRIRNNHFDTVQGKINRNQSGGNAPDTAYLDPFCRRLCRLAWQSSYIILHLAGALS